MILLSCMLARCVLQYHSNAYSARRKVMEPMTVAKPSVSWGPLMSHLSYDMNVVNTEEQVGDTGTRNGEVG